MSKSAYVSILVEKKDAVLKFGSKKLRVDLSKMPILLGIDKVINDPRKVQGITVVIKDTTFSTVRQIVAAVNTLAWVLGINVNGKRQMHAAYSGEPNITV